MATEREKEVVLRCLVGVGNLVIVDLGAHKGEEYDWLQPYANQYVMVEPDVENAQVILERIDDLDIPSGVGALVIGAIASFDGYVNFNSSVHVESGVRGSGSIRRPAAHLEHFPKIVFPECRRTSVPCFTLDTLYRRQGLERVDLLWVDVQGAEADMIAGGAEALSNTRYLFMEAEPEFRMYEGQLLKPELLAMLPDWDLIEDFGENVLLRNSLCA